MTWVAGIGVGRFCGVGQRKWAIRVTSAAELDAKRAGLEEGQRTRRGTRGDRGEGQRGRLTRPGHHVQWAMVDSESTRNGMTNLRNGTAGKTSAQVHR